MDNYYEVKNLEDQSVESDSNTPVNKSGQSKKKFDFNFDRKTALTALIVFLVVTAISAGIFYMLKNKGKKTTAEVTTGSTTISLLPQPTEASANNATKQIPAETPKASTSTKTSTTKTNAKPTSEITRTSKPKTHATAEATGDKISTSIFEGDGVASSSSASSSSSNGTTSVSSSADSTSASASAKSSSN